MFLYFWKSQALSHLHVYINIDASEIPYSSLRSDHSLFLVPRNYDPTLHPFEVCREYTRALNATKIERVFAKPFLASLDGHRDGVNCMAKHATSLSTLLSGSCDGEVTIGQSINTLPQLVTWFVMPLELWHCAHNMHYALSDRMFYLTLRWKFGILLNMNASARSKHMKVLSGAWLSAIVEHPSLRWLLPINIWKQVFFVFFLLADL